MQTVRARSDPVIEPCTFGKYSSSSGSRREVNGRYVYFRMDFRTPFPVHGFHHVVIDVPFDGATTAGRHDGHRVAIARDKQWNRRKRNDRRATGAR